MIVAPFLRVAAAGAVVSRRFVAGRPLTVAVSVLALVATLPVLAAGPGAPLAAALELRGPRAGGGSDWWRPLTAHLVHLDRRQLLLNLAAFFWLGSLCEPRLRPARYATLLLASALGISILLMLVHPDLAAYRGLSGVAGAQFAALAALRWREARGIGLPGAAVAAASLLLFLLKSVYEIDTGHALFAAGVEAAGAAPSPVAHLAGAAAGIALSVLPGAGVPAARVG